MGFRSAVAALSYLGSSFCVSPGVHCLPTVILVFFVLFLRLVLVCTPDCPETSNIDQTDPELIEIHLPLPPECQDKHIWFLALWKAY